MLRNEIPIKDCENVLRVPHETAKFYQIHSNLKIEIKKWNILKIICITLNITSLLH